MLKDKLSIILIIILIFTLVANIFVFINRTKKIEAADKRIREKQLAAEGYARKVLPISFEKELLPVRVITGVVYAYNSEVNQTDGDPFTTASGQKTRVGIVGNNCLPFGTVIEIAGKKLVVQDRMNERYNCNTFDMWLPTRAEALKWGRRHELIKIYN